MTVGTTPWCKTLLLGFSTITCAQAPARLPVDSVSAQLPFAAEPFAEPQTTTRRQEIVQGAQALLQREMYTARGFRFDKNAVGFVQAAYWTAGVDLFDASVAKDPSLNGFQIAFRTALKRTSLSNTQPRVGALAFWGSGGKKAANITGIGVVESVDTDGTIWVLQHEKTAKRIPLNFRKPAGIAGFLGFADYL